MVFRTFTVVEELHWYYFLQLVSHPPGRYGIWLYHGFALPTFSLWFFFFGRAVSFFGRFQRPPIDSCSTASCIFVTRAGGDKCTSFYSAILTEISYKFCVYLYIPFQLSRQNKISIGVETPVRIINSSKIKLEEIIECTHKTKLHSSNSLPQQQHEFRVPRGAPADFDLVILWESLVLKKTKNKNKKKTWHSLDKLYHFNIQDFRNCKITMQNHPGMTSKKH